MTQIHSTTSASVSSITTRLPRKFQHLTFSERLVIQRNQRKPKQERLSQTQLADLLGKDKSTISRELKRGSVEQLNWDYTLTMRYHADVGQRRYEEHRTRSKWAGKRKAASEFVHAVDELIYKDKRSPAQAAALALKALDPTAGTVCLRTLYSYIHQGFLRSDMFSLHLALARKSSAAKRKSKASQIPDAAPANRKSIEDRPAEANERIELGHMEIDLILGRKGSKAAILSLDDRKTRKRYMTKTEGRTTEDIRVALRRLINRMPLEERAQIKSITCDNGAEFQRLAEDFPEYIIYYAHPYSPGERGTNERQNGLVRYFIPKGCNMDEVTEEKIQEVATWINTMPREMFGWNSSNEVMTELLQRC